MYLIESSRLGLRSWQPDDMDTLWSLCSDPLVMQHFPKTLDRKETEAFIGRLIAHQEREGFSYFAADVLTTGQCIGFIGMARQTYTAPFTPCVDIGWRLLSPAWGKGYATEGALACMDYAKHTLKLPEIYSVAVTGNKASLRVMEKIGLEYHGDFFHPALKDYPKLHQCKVYRKVF